MSPHHKVKSSGPTRIGQRGKVAIENAPLDSLPLIVQPPSPQAEEASVVEAAGISSDPIAGVRDRITLQNYDSHKKKTHKLEVAL